MQVQAQFSRIGQKNFSVFTKREVTISPELLEMSKDWQSHPDFGILPYQNPPEIYCVELIDRRDRYSRYFVESGSGGTHFFRQQAYSPINYKDSDGRWREINYRLSPDKKSEGIFTAAQQPTPFVLNLIDRYSSVQFNGDVLKFNHSLKLVHVDENGNQNSLGIPDWSNYSAGDDGLRIFNFYPGIDLVFTFSTGAMETSFILKQNLNLSGGFLILMQDFDIPEGMSFYPTSDRVGGVHEDLHIGGVDKVPVFTIEKCYAYDNAIIPQRQDLHVKVEKGNRLAVFTAVEWLNDPSTVYPVVIDPVVTTQNSIAAGAITGTQFSPVCWTNSCDFFLTVPTPANTTITNIYASFEYFATGACFAQDGGFSIDFASCTYPTAAPGVITCPFAVSNFNCGILNATTLPDFTSCLPAPQCASQNLDFTLHFYRCNNDPSAICGNACIRASQPWMMTIEGRTMEMIYNSPNQIICTGDSVNVVTITQFGVQPYQYVWSPLSTNNDTIRVSPTVNTNYSVTVTDACGTTGSGSSSVQVTPYNNPGFSISPNPACIGQAITLQGFGSGPLSSYDWIVPGSNATGGVINNTNSPIIQYTVPGVYQITLSYTSNSCIFDSTLTMVIDGASAADVSLSSLPAGAVCPGDTVRFFASPVNGGSLPTYDWYIDGILVQSGLSDSLKSNTFFNGSLVQVVLTSNSPCSNPQIDTAALFVVFSNAVTPAVSVSPDTSVCPGAAVTFTAAPVNGGVAPAYQWTINGLPAAGGTTSIFNTIINLTDTVIGVNMISSLSCVISPNATDTVHISFEPQIAPVVSLSASPAGAVCANDPVTYTARTNGGGATPTYQWYLNGIASGGVTPDSTFLINNPSQGDSISVRMTSSHTCLLSTSASSWSLMTVTAAASPAVSLSVLPSLSVCEGDTVVFTASANAAGASPVYHWFVNSTPQLNSDSIFSTYTLNDQDLVWVEVISSLSCAILPADTDSVVVSVSPISNPSVTIMNTGNGTCVGDTIHWSATTSNGGPSPAFQWTVNGISQGFNTDTFSFMPQDGDQIQVTLISNSQCALIPVVQSNTLTVNLQQYVSPVITIHASPFDTICAGQQVSISSLAQNGGASPQYIWTINGIVIGTNSPTFISDTFQHGDIIQLRMISNAPCLIQPDTTSNFIRILTYTALTVQLNGSGNNCPGTPVLLSARAGGGDGGPYTYSWFHSFEQTDSVIVQPKISTQYTVQVKDNCGTTFINGSIVIPVLSGPTSALSFSPDELSTFNNLVQFQNLSQNAVSWRWDFGDSTFSVLLNPQHTYDSAGTYELILVTQSSNGCTDTLRYRIVVTEDIAVFFPTAFSPNGDFRNETWQPIGASLKAYEFRIFDRWGQLIFTGNEDMAWDGHVHLTSTPAQNGVYIYHVDLKEEKFGEKIVVGRVTLIR